MKFFKRHFLPILGLVAFLAFLPFLVKLVQFTRQYLTRALGQPANILVDPQIVLGPLPRPWLALAQGGEEVNPQTLKPVETQIAALNPRYIRVDHVFDFYGVINKDANGNLSYNFEKLDQLVAGILATGAKPMLSLSYMPPAIASGDITSPPVNWPDWQAVVQRTIEHYSGKSEKNLTDMAYEVWNEPDLFGNWTIGGKKDYRLLYQYAVWGAERAKNTNSFKIGGPGITAPYKNWVGGFLDFIVKNNLRIDFYSWHRYSRDPEKFLEDINKVDTWLFQNAGYTLEKYLTEWGSDSENSPLNDNNFAAAHLVATIRQILRRVDLVFTFEIKDGPSPEGKKYWGRWGLLTHEKAGPPEKKPKYDALQLLNQINGKQISLKGEGTWITGFAAKDNNKIKIILVNLDQGNRHFENVPLTINNLEPGNYQYLENFLSGPGRTLTETINNGIFRGEIPLSANNIVVVEFRKI